MADEVKADPQLIKQLREHTGLPLAECRRWVIESGNDLEKAKALARAHFLRTRPQWMGLDLPPPEPR